MAVNYSWAGPTRRAPGGALNEKPLGPAGPLSSVEPRAEERRTWRNVREGRMKVWAGQTKE